MLSNVIGEVYLYHILHRDGYDFENYFDKMMNLYGQRLSKEEFQKGKTKLLMDSIKNRLNIKREGMTPEEDKRVRDYFLDRYVTNGFVAHSFHGNSINSINHNGLSPSKRIWDDSDIMRIAGIFKNHNMEFALGGYPHYKGEGIYYENNMNAIYNHSIFSPEWFNVFTSSDHSVSLMDISKNPYIVRDYDACRQNVEDLTENAGLNHEERKETLRFFEKQYYALSDPEPYVALIPKSVVGKDKIQNAVGNTRTAFETMNYVLQDSNHEYEEHIGNVSTETIEKRNMYITKLPRASKYIKQVNFKRETKEELYNGQKKKVDKIMKNEKLTQKIESIGNDSSLSREQRIAELQAIRGKALEKKEKKNQMNSMFTQDSNNPTMQNQQAPKVKVNTNNQGFANSLLIIAISMMTLISAVLLYLVK